MALELEAFADESGIQKDAKYCFVMGFVGEPATWESYAREWKRVLAEYGATDFHSKDFFAWAKDGRRIGQYADWSDDKAILFARDLGEVITALDLDPVGGGLNVEEFNALPIGERRLLTGGLVERSRWKRMGAPTKPYYFLFQAFLSHAMGNAPEDSVVHFIFDRQNVLEKHAVGVFERLAQYVRENPETNKRWTKIGRLTFGSRLVDIQLQAADYLAYAWHSHHTRGMSMGPERMQAIASMMGKRFLNMFEGDFLQAFLNDYFKSEDRDWIRGQR